MEIKIFGLPRRIAEWHRQSVGDEIERLEAALGKSMTDEEREKYKSREVVRLRTAYLVAPAMRQDTAFRGVGSTTEHVIAYQKEIDELNGLSPQELDWRRNNQIRYRLADLRSNLNPQSSNSNKRP